jgi:hypothetical protein
MGEVPGFEWPDFGSLGVRAHPSLGRGPVYRGRPSDAGVLILADQRSHDDLFTGRALTGKAGQHLQVWLRAAGITRRYVIIRVLPVDTRDLHHSTVRSIVNRQQVRRVYAKIVDEIAADNADLGLIIAVGSHSNALLPHVNGPALPTVSIKAYGQSGWFANWRSGLTALSQLSYPTDLSSPSFAYDGSRGQIPRSDLPYGSLRWNGTSGNRAIRAREGSQLSPDYYKLYMPRWAFRLRPEPLSAAEQQAVDAAP